MNKQPSNPSWLNWRTAAGVLVVLLLVGYIAGRPALENLLGVKLPAIINTEENKENEEDVADADREPAKPDKRNDVAKSSNATTFKRTSLGRGRFKTPEGLQYTASRLDHVMRHTKDDPGRDKNHGVFDVNGENEVLALIDRAYAKTKIKSPKDFDHSRQRARPGVMRDVYTIDMRQRIGWVGGNARNKPPCNYVKLVLENKTVITAYPTNRRK